MLIEREWVEFGHKFSDRCGIGRCCEDINERCPVFLQWLDCVHHLLYWYPTAFQFNQAFLVGGEAVIFIDFSFLFYILSLFFLSMLLY